MVALNERVMATMDGCHNVVVVAVVVAIVAVVAVVAAVVAVVAVAVAVAVAAVVAAVAAVVAAVAVAVGVCVSTVATHCNSQKPTSCARHNDVDRCSCSFRGCLLLLAVASCC